LKIKSIVVLNLTKLVGFRIGSIHRAVGHVVELEALF
jgi:hypothetical protein